MPWDYTDNQLAAETALYQSLSDYQKGQINDLLTKFPAILDQAQSDYAKFSIGKAQGLFSAEQNVKITTWFTQFPKFWETIRDNYTQSTGDGRTDAYLSGILHQADKFAADIKGDQGLSVQLGSPLIIAGLIVAGVLGVAGIIWGVSYIQQQNNISNIIDGVVKGQIPPDVLQAAINKQKTGGDLLGTVESFGKYLLIGAGLYLAWPIIQGIIGKVTAKQKTRANHARG